MTAVKPSARSKSGTRRSARSRHDPVRLAALRGVLAFEQGRPLATEPPASLRGAAERRLFTHLLRGVVRHRRLLEAEVKRLAGTPLDRLDAPVVALAMLGLYQLRFLEMPAHAAVYETVALAAPLRLTSAKGWVNAILRTAQREGWREEQSPQPLTLAERTSHPDWMVDRWTAYYGRERTAAICKANNRYEGAALRVETRRIRSADLLRRLNDEGAQAAPHPLLPSALWCEQVGAVLASRAFAEGLCYVQDVSSQLLMQWCAPRLKGRVLHLCAAPGGKLTHLLGKGRPDDWIVGADLSLERLMLTRGNLSRLRLPPAPLLLADGTRLPFADGAGGGFAGWDAALVDAPCSATGMIRKYPELKWRKHADDLPRFAATQSALLAEAARVAGPGGVVLYATCSLEPEENEGVVDAFLALRPDFRRIPLSDLTPPKGLGADPQSLLSPRGDLQLFPGHGVMGLYGALLERSP